MKILPGTGMSRHAMPPAWLRTSGGRSHLLMTAPQSGVVEGGQHLAQPPLHHGRVNSPPDCSALSGGQGDLTIEHGPPPRPGEDRVPR